jgi:hypothetical protein
VLSVLNAVVFLLLVQLALFHVYLNCKGISTYEYILSKKPKSKPNKVGGFFMNGLKSTNSQSLSQLKAKGPRGSQISVKISVKDISKKSSDSPGCKNDSSGTEQPSVTNLSSAESRQRTDDAAVSNRTGAFKTPIGSFVEIKKQRASMQLRRDRDFKTKIYEGKKLKGKMGTGSKLSSEFQKMGENRIEYVSSRMSNTQRSEDLEGLGGLKESAVGLVSKKEKRLFNSEVKRKYKEDAFKMNNFLKKVEVEEGQKWSRSATEKSGGETDR